MMLEPNETALVQFMLGMKKRKPIESPRIEQFEDDYATQWVTTSAQTNANSASATLSLTDGSMLVVGDILLVPSGSSSNHEQVIVTAKPSTNVATIERNVGATGLLTITSGAGLLILGQAHEEGSGAPVSKYTTPSNVANYTQIFKKPINITGTDANSKHYADMGKGERNRLLDKAGKEFKIHKNNQYIWGKPSETLTGGLNGNPRRTTGGIDHFIATNRYDVGGLFTKRSMETFARMAFRYTSKAVLLASPIVISAIHEWGNGFMKLEPQTTMYGVDVRKVTSGQGQWILIRDWSMRDGVSGQNGFSGYAFSLDMDYITERYLKNRDTHIDKDIQGNDEDRHLDMIMCESGLQVRQEKRHARLFGATDYSA